jgi:hypothetical protein
MCSDTTTYTTETDSKGYECVSVANASFSKWRSRKACKLILGNASLLLEANGNLKEAMINRKIKKVMESSEKLCENENSRSSLESSAHETYQPSKHVTLLGEKLNETIFRKEK